ncbi:MAG: galactokinase [Propionibacteriales bacterium]|nr:galactokinase [Propionibacteriales bacterium]
MNSATASAPGRVNLIGEHLDYNGGLCLPIAIDRRTSATVRRAAVSRRSSDVEPAGWTGYVEGVLAALAVDEPLDVAVSSTVPVGAGLSSSAALTCSVAVAVDALLGLGLDRDALAAACIRAENEHVGVPTGGMDQAAALYGAVGHALLLDFSAGSRTLVPFDPAGAGLDLLVVDTGVAHRLASSGYSDRRADCERAAAVLGLEHLAAATYEQLADLPEERLRRRARHVVTEQYRVRSFVAALQQSDWSEVGDLMTASHLSLRDDFEVSCPELDLVVTSALAAGALGARLTGGGFGGSAVVLCHADQRAGVSGRIIAEFARHARNAPTLYRVEASSAAAQVS